jgi:hypothetical protein
VQVIERRLRSSLYLVIGVPVAAAGVLGHALTRLPSAHVGDGGVDRGVMVELAVGSALAVVALVLWLIDGPHTAVGQRLLTRVIVIGLLAGAAVTGAVALLVEAGNGCLGACG